MPVNGKKVIVISDSDDDKKSAKRKRFVVDKGTPKKIAKRGVLRLTSSQEEPQRTSLRFCPTQETVAESSKETSRTGEGVFHQLWSTKYAPKSEAEIVVHKIKVMEVRNFLSAQLQDDRREGLSKILLVIGPPGCGKSSTVRLLAKGLGFNITEWKAPVPTLWTEFQHQADPWQTFISKLDAFDEFISHVKLAPLQLMKGDALECPPTGPGNRKTLILVDDMPQVNGVEMHRRLANSVGTLALTSCHPIIIILTTSLNAKERNFGGTSFSRLQMDLQTVLQAAGGTEVTFNPLTALTIKKVLLKVAEAEDVLVGSEEITYLSEACCGDLSNAIETLRLFSSGRVDTQLHHTSKFKKSKARKGRKRDKHPVANPSLQLQSLLRDANLFTFHALGKVLYNKRIAAGSQGPETGSFSASSEMLEVLPSVNLHPSFDRLKTEVNPEHVLAASGMEPAAAAAFLQENFPLFVEDGAISDLATGVEYLSDSVHDRSVLGADVLFNERSIGANNGLDLQGLCSASTASRGIMWSNTHPAPKSFLGLKGSMWSVANRARLINNMELHRMGSHGVVGRGHDSIRDTASDTLPFLRIMAHYASTASNLGSLPEKWAYLEDRQVAVESIESIPVKSTMHPELMEEESIDDSIEDPDAVR